MGRFLFKSELLHEWRIKTYYTQQQAADRVGVCLATWKKYESGKVNCPYFRPRKLETYTIVQAFATAVGFESPEDLLEDVVGYPRPTTTIQTIRSIYVATKIGAGPDAEVVHTLTEALSGRGYEVSVASDDGIGLDCALRDDQRVRESDLVIAILSEDSVHSPLFHHRLDAANDARSRGEKPRIVTISIGGPRPLPPALACLTTTRYFVWMSAEDSRPMVAQLLREIRTPCPARPLLGLPYPELHGAVGVESPFYVVRDADEKLRDALSNHDSIVCIEGTRQTGKTSLLMQGAQMVRQLGGRAALTSLDALEPAAWPDINAFLRKLAESLADGLALDVWPGDVWDPLISPVAAFTKYLETEFMARIDRHVMWGIDKIDLLAGRDYRSSVIGLFRSLHNKRSENSATPLHRLTLVLAHATEPQRLVDNIHQSPFNVCTPVRLDDFSARHVAQLNAWYRSPLRNRTEIRRFHALTGGQPLLSQTGLRVMANEQLDIDSLEEFAQQQHSPFQEHLEGLSRYLHSPALRKEMRGLLKGSSRLSAEGYYALRDAGFIRGNSKHDATIRCQLYANFLRHYLL